MTPHPEPENPMAEIQMRGCSRCKRPHLAALLDVTEGKCPLCCEKEVWEEAERSDRVVMFLLSLLVPAAALVFCFAKLLK